MTGEGGEIEWGRPEGVVACTQASRLRRECSGVLPGGMHIAAAVPAASQARVQQQQQVALLTAPGEGGSIVGVVLGTYGISASCMCVWNSV